MDRNLLNVFITIGWALLAGFLIFMVPLCYRKAKYAENTTQRIVNIISLVVFLAAFCILAWWLWDTKVPKSDKPAVPAADPVAITEPA